MTDDPSVLTFRGRPDDELADAAALVQQSAVAIIRNYLDLLTRYQSFTTKFGRAPVVPELNAVMSILAPDCLTRDALTAPKREGPGVTDQVSADGQSSAAFRAAEAAFETDLVVCIRRHLTALGGELGVIHALVETLGSVCVAVVRETPMAQRHVDQQIGDLALFVARARAPRQ